MLDIRGTGAPFSAGIPQFAALHGAVGRNCHSHQRLYVRIAYQRNVGKWKEARKTARRGILASDQLAGCWVCHIAATR